MVRGMRKKKSVQIEAHESLGHSFEQHLRTLRSNSHRKPKARVTGLSSSMVSEATVSQKPRFCLWLSSAFFCASIGAGGYYGFEHWKTLPSYPWKNRPRGRINGILTSNIDTYMQSEALIRDINNNFNDTYVTKKLKNLRLTEVLLDRDQRMELRNVPLLLDIPGTGSEYLSPALNKCLGLSSSSNFRDFETENSPHFAVTNKLCGMAKRFKVGKASLMVVFRNPVERVVQEYISLLDEKKTSARSVAEYVRRSSYVDNLQTRILICKPKGELNEKDFNIAKYILANMSVLSMYQDYSNSFKSYREAFSWTNNNTSTISITDSSNQCIEDEFLKSASLTTIELEERLNDKNVVKLVRDKNQFDMKLYLFVKQYIDAI